MHGLYYTHAHKCKFYCTATCISYMKTTFWAPPIGHSNLQAHLLALTAIDTHLTAIRTPPLFSKCYATDLCIVKSYLS